MSFREQAREFMHPGLRRGDNKLLNLWLRLMCPAFARAIKFFEMRPHIEMQEINLLMWMQRTRSRVAQHCKAHFLEAFQ